LSTGYSVRVAISIGADELLRMYRGESREAIARDDQGRVVRFPVAILRPFVNQNGVHGRFEIYFDENNRFQRIDRVG